MGRVLGVQKRRSKDLQSSPLEIVYVHGIIIC